MGFDTMRSYQQLVLSTRTYATDEHSKALPDERRTVSMPFAFNSNSQPKSKLRHRDVSRSKTSLGLMISRDDHAVPAFQSATSRWSPPPSPTTASPQLPPTPPPHARVDSARGQDSLPSLPIPSSLPSPPISPQTSPKTLHQNALDTQLYEACCHGHAAVVVSLLDQGASVHSSTLVPQLFEAFKPAKAGHLSPLAGAASHGHLHIAEVLLQHGAVLNPLVVKSASSPLHQACRNDDFDMARFLLRRGADINLDNSYNTTPLMYAVKYGSSQLVRLLLAHKPDMRKVSFIGAAAIHWSVWPKRPHITELLLQHGRGTDANHPMADGNTPLHCAVIAEAPKMVACLLHYAADPLRLNDASETPLMLAERLRESPACQNAEQIVRLLKNAI